MFTDTHCHVYSEYYEDIDQLVKEIKANKINKIINNGCDDKSNKEVLNLIKKYDFMYGAIGIHPESADTYQKEELDYLEKHLNDDKVVAIGEIGLDYHYGKENRDKQIELFEYQLKLAEKYNKPVIIHSRDTELKKQQKEFFILQLELAREFQKPVIIHSRDATLDTIEILKKYHIKGVMHSFSGSYETACIYLKMGLLLGINGVITFKNCNLKDVVSRLSIKDIVLETDSPYLTPVPYRGKQNNPGHVLDIAKYIAELKNISLDELATEINGNVSRCFDI